MKQLMGYVKAPALEIGCGKGKVLAMSPQGTVGVDMSTGALRALKASGLKNDVVQAIAQNLPFRDGVFETAYCYEVLMHIDEIDCAVREMKRVSRNQVGVENTKTKDWRVRKPHDWKGMGITLIENIPEGWKPKRRWPFR